MNRCGCVGAPATAAAAPAAAETAPRACRSSLQPPLAVPAFAAEFAQPELRGFSSGGKCRRKKHAVRQAEKAFDVMPDRYKSRLADEEAFQAVAKNAAPGRGVEGLMQPRQ